jgi:purine nucleoside permease
MGERSGALASQFEQALAELAKTVESCSAAQWQAVCGDEGWTVAATAHHVAAQWPLEREYISAAAEGAPPPTHTWDEINSANERRAQTARAISKDEVLKLLRDGGASMAAYVRGFNDEQLDRTAPLALADGAAVPAQALIEGGVLIDHVNGHLKSIRAAG